jgi:hypothetical protein
VPWLIGCDGNPLEAKQSPGPTTCAGSNSPKGMSAEVSRPPSSIALGSISPNATAA